MKYKDKLKRRTISFLLYAALGNLELGWRMLGMVLEQEGAVSIAREGPIMEALTDKERRLLTQRKTKIFEACKDVQKIALHLHKTSK